MQPHHTDPSMKSHSIDPSKQSHSIHPSMQSHETQPQSDAPSPLNLTVRLYVHVETGGKNLLQSARASGGN